MPAFTTWTFAGVRFLAARQPDGSVYIINEAGESFGAWQTEERFRFLQKQGDNLALFTGARLVVAR